MSTPIKKPYQSPELRVYGTLGDLTLTAGGSGNDNPDQGCGSHNSLGYTCSNPHK